MIFATMKVGASPGDASLVINSTHGSFDRMRQAKLARVACDHCRMKMVFSSFLLFDFLSLFYPIDQ